MYKNVYNLKDLPEEKLGLKLWACLLFLFSTSLFKEGIVYITVISGCHVHVLLVLT